MEIKKYELYLKPVQTCNISLKKIRTPKDVYTIMEKMNLTNYPNEVAHILLLNAKGQVIGVSQVGFGELSKCEVNIQLVMQVVLLSNASAVIFIHNHPSEDIEPSGSDVNISQNLQKVLSLINVSFMDSIIINSKGDFLSLKERGDII